jgi:molybdopterin/thiamine biosynthesis adenylyltransferase
VADPGGGAAVRDPVRYVDEMVSRNSGIVQADEQAALHATKLLVAGCGSVGGAVVEPAVRLGVGSLVLADPDVFELHNANRQSCVVEDMGRPKVEVHAERARAINPFIDVATYTEGVTPENIEACFAEITQVFDGIGIDSRAALWAKYLVHKHAAARRLPVISGSDLGGKALLYVFDYRRDPRTFFGRARVKAFREGNEFEALQMSGPRPVPADFFPVIRQRMDEGQPWPQVAYCTHALGALTGRTIIDLAMHRRVRERVSTDVHLQVRGPVHTVVQRARWPVEAFRTRRRMNEMAPSPNGDADRAEERLRSLGLLDLCQALRTAPSRYNSQPWLVVPEGRRQATIEIDGERLLRWRDRDGHDLLLALGCAVEAASRTGRVDAALEAGGRGEPRIRIEFTGAEDGARGGLGLLARRRTALAPFDGPALDARLVEELGLPALRSPEHRLAVADVLDRIRDAELRSEPYAEELYAWLRFGDRDKDWDEDGLDASALGLARRDAAIGRALKRSLAARRLATRTGWAGRLATESAAPLRAGGGELLLVAAPSTDRDALLAAGRLLMSAWLRATEAGLAVHPHSLSGLPASAREEVRAAFRAPGDEVPLLVLQLGRTERRPKGSARLPLARLCRLDG